MTIKPLDDSTRMDAFTVLITNYRSGIESTLAEVSDINNTDGIVLYDGVRPIGLCSVYKHKIYGYCVTNCVVYEDYKGTKFAYRLLREMKRMTNRKRFVVSYEEDLHGYLGKVNSIEHIILTKSVPFGKNFRRIRGK